MSAGTSCYALCVCLVVLWPCLDIYCAGICSTFQTPSSSSKDVVSTFITPICYGVNEAYYLAQLAQGCNKTDTQQRLGRVCSQDVVALGMAMSSSPTLWSRMKYLKNYGMECHEILHRHARSPEDESYWLRQFHDLSSTMRLTF